MPLSSPSTGYFYHKADWYDVDGDGLLDLITARATKPLFGSGSGELLWLKQPSSSPLTNGGCAAPRTPLLVARSL